MRTRKRTALTFVTAGSALCLAFALVFAVRSYFRQDAIFHITTDRVLAHGAYTLNGSLTLIRFDNGVFVAPVPTGWLFESKRNTLPTWRMTGTLGFWANDYAQPNASGSITRVRQLSLPLWLFALLAAILPLWQAIAWWRARRRAERPGFEVEGNFASRSVDRTRLDSRANGEACEDRADG